MDLQYKPPLQETDECNWLQQNFITCLKQKAIKDDIPEFKCVVENILWFNLECPDRYKQYQDKAILRSIFLHDKKAGNLDRPAYVKL